MSALPRALLLAVAMLHSGANAAVRIKDISHFQGERLHTIVGYGLVTGLAGTGDSASNKATRQSVANLLAQFRIAIPVEAINSRNVAAVIVSASLPAFSRPGDTIDVTVTSVGDARSLVGGNLLMVPLQGPDNKLYAMAQGALTVGGYKYDSNGNVLQKNHPTAAVVPNGATVEVSPPRAASLAEGVQTLSVALQEPDYTTAGRIADAINTEFGQRLAKPLDAQNLSVQVPADYKDRLVDLVRRVESLNVTPDQRARVVINERTGTVVAGAEVNIAPVALSFGDLKISVVSETAVSQPVVIGGFAPNAATVPYTNTRVDVREAGGAALVTKPGGSVGDLIQALNKLKTNTRDIVSILKALKAAGSLHAELIVQ